eukprot:4646986-Karenia_brevis.AAC.1
MSSSSASALQQPWKLDLLDQSVKSIAHAKQIQSKPSTETVAPIASAGRSSKCNPHGIEGPANAQAPTKREQPLYISMPALVPKGLSLPSFANWPATSPQCD